MVGKFIAWLLSRAGYEVMTPNSVFAARVRDQELANELEKLQLKVIELDSVICSTMECVEEIRDAQHAVPPAQQCDVNSLADIFNEYLFGYRKRSDDE